jgi:hypothetical protein
MLRNTLPFGKSCSKDAVTIVSKSAGVSKELCGQSSAQSRERASQACAGLRVKVGPDALAWNTAASSDYVKSLVQFILPM